MTVAEATRVERWIFTLLSQDGTIAGIIGNRVYAGIAPQTAQTPYVVMTQLSPGEDTPAAGGGRIWARPLYLIKAVTKSNSATTLQVLADRMETLLQGQKGGTTDVSIHYCVRERGFRLTTVEPPGSGDIYQHVGGEWRIAVAPTVNP